MKFSQSSSTKRLCVNFISDLQSQQFFIYFLFLQRSKFTLLRGLKQFPVDITAIVSVCDDGSSTGILREEFNIPAVGDIRRVLVSLSETEPLVMELFNYRFKTTSDLDGHTVGNLLLTAMTEITGNLSDSIEALSKVMNLKGKSHRVDFSSFRIQQAFLQSYSSVLLKIKPEAMSLLVSLCSL